MARALGSPLRPVEWGEAGERSGGGGGELVVREGGLRVNEGAEGQDGEADFEEGEAGSEEGDVCGTLIR